MGYDRWVVGHARVSTRLHKRLTLDDLLSFFHQLSTLVGSGTPLLRSLQIATEQTESVRLKKVLEEIAGQLAAGSPFHTAAAAHPKVFEHA
jgi:type II secretory pathway component PulF